MKKTIIFFFFLISVSNLKAQDNERIINDMLFSLFGRHKDTIFIDRNLRNPDFNYDSATIEDKTGFKLPNNIILEWRKNKESLDSITHWNEYKLNNSYFKNYTFVGTKPVFKCIDEKQISTLLKQKRKSIFTISKIIFDDKKENAIFRFSSNARGGVFIEETVLIKNIFGKWIIISKFDWILK